MIRSRGKIAGWKVADEVGCSGSEGGTKPSREDSGRQKKVPGLRDLKRLTTQAVMLKRDVAMGFLKTRPRRGRHRWNEGGRGRAVGRELFLFPWLSVALGRHNEVGVGSVKTLPASARAWRESTPARWRAPLHSELRSPVGPAHSAAGLAAPNMDEGTAKPPH